MKAIRHEHKTQSIRKQSATLRRSHELVCITRQSPGNFGGKYPLSRTDPFTLLAKADTGHLTLAREPVRLDELVRACFTEAQLLAYPHGLQVELNACEAVTVLGDRHRLKQLLLNLADNATKYAQPGGRVTIALNCEREMAEVVVTNTGPGITPEQLPRVFVETAPTTTPSKAPVWGCALRSG